MAAGLFALLDDVAALARIAAASVDDVGVAATKASAKAAGVVVDDTAVTPQFLQGSPAERELPIIKKIAIGSLRNKLLFILPAAMLLSEFLPWLLPILLILGGTYLAYEGAEKIWERVSGHGSPAEQELTTQGELTPDHERQTVRNAVRTDFILSAEIMVISLKEVLDTAPDAGFVTRAVILAVVAVLITGAVFGVVAILVKMDDVGLHLTGKSSPGLQRVGHALVAAMPKVLAAIAVTGTGAMLWVGGYILVSSFSELGGAISGPVGTFMQGPYDVVHDWEKAIQDAVDGGFGATLAWLVNTLTSALVGLLVGAVIVAIKHVLRGRSTRGHEGAAVEDGREDSSIDH